MHQSDDNPEDNFTVEISDLPSDDMYGGWARRVNAAWRLYSRMRNRRRISSALIVSLIVLLIFGSGSSLAGGVFDFLMPPGRSSGSQHSIDVAGQDFVDEVTDEGNGVMSLHRLEAGRLFTLRPGPTPQECFPDHLISQKYKQRPFWIADFNGPYGVIHLSQIDLTTLRDWRGWAVPLMVEWRSSYVAPFTLKVGDIGPGPVPTIVTDTHMPPVTSLVLEPHASHSIMLPGGRHAAAWNITLYLPGSGCYYFDGSWPNADWWIIFSAGT